MGDARNAKHGAALHAKAVPASYAGSPAASAAAGTVVLRRKRRWPKVLAGIGIALVVLIVAAVAAVMLYVNSLNSSMSLGEATEEIKGALAKAEENKPFYVLVMGVDMREGLSAENLRLYYGDDAEHGSDGSVKSDTIMLVRVDTLNSKVSLLTIPRDTPYEFEDGVIRGINNAYVLGGATKVISTVEDITGLEISHYAELGGSDLVTLIDGLGGIDVDVPITFDYTNITGESVHLDAGVQHVDGEQALALAGMRVLYEGTNRDVKRQTAGRQVVEAMINTILSQPATAIPGTIADAAACVKTDLSVSDLVDLANKVGGHPTVYTGTAPNDGSQNPYMEFDPPQDTHPWATYVDDEGWERIMTAFTNGEDIGQVSYKGDLVHYAGQPEDTWSRGLVKPSEL